MNLAYFGLQKQEHKMRSGGWGRGTEIAMPSEIVDEIIPKALARNSFLATSSLAAETYLSQKAGLNE